MLHRLLILGTLLAAAGATADEAGSIPTANEPDKVRIYIGTYTRGESQGIYLCELDRSTGKISLVGPAVSGAESIANPSFLALHPDGRFLYAVSEVDAYQETRGGAVAALAIGPDGQLSLVNHRPSGGVGPCHVAVDRAGRNALVANYGSGSAAVLPIGPDGSLAPATSVVQHAGSSVNRQRQEGPHAHSINVDPTERFAVVADLGVDKVFSYRFDPAAGTLAANEGLDLPLAPGSGPRHFAFHPSGKFAYVNNELTSTVTALAYDAQRGACEELQTVSTLPEGFAGNNTTAEVQVHPSGKFLYCSNRGHDSLAMFAIDAATGRLTPLGQHPSGGKTPRNFGIDPGGRFLVSAHQDSHTVVVHRIDPQSGRLAAVGSEVNVPTPVCVRFVP